MGKSEQVKEKIIENTIVLLKKNSGNIDKITIRDIAAVSDIGVGLINYHFGTKDNLVEQCVQRIISQIISAFYPPIDEKLNATDKLKVVAKQVADILIANPELSRISILGDLVTPKLLDNTMKSVLGFATTVDKERKDETKMLSFCMTMIIQGTFLRKDTTKDTIGFDFNLKEDRDTFIDFMIGKLFQGGRL